MFIDTHCHPYLSKKKDSNVQFENFLKLGGEKLICIATDPDHSMQCIDFAKENDFVYASIGVHPCCIGFDGESLPHHIDILESKTDLSENVGILAEIYEKHPEKIVAIGECGLDYHWLDSLAKEHQADPELIKKLQKIYFKSQIELARELKLPFIIHDRKASEDIFEILVECNYSNFVLHSYANNLEFAERCIKKFPECMISFSGIVTFKNAPDIQETAANIPLKHIMIETDSPYLTPVPYRGQQENEPAFTKHVLDKITELRPEPAKQIQTQILQNSKDFFGI